MGTGNSRLVGAQTRGWLLGWGIALLSSSTVMAQTPSGCFNYALGGNALVYDVSGTYDEDVTGLDLDDDLSFTQDPKGKIGGGLTFGFTEDDISVAGTLTVRGKVRASKGVIRVKLAIKLRGVVTAFGDVANFKAKSKLRLEINTGTQMMAGTMKAKACVSGLGCDKFDGVIDIPLPAGMDGTADLQICVASANGKTLRGAGTLTLASGRTAQFLVKGKYSPRRNGSKISVKGDANSRGNKVKLLTVGLIMELARLKGKLFGQKVLVEAPVSTSVVDIARGN